MTDIRPLSSLTVADLHRVASGYTSYQRFEVEHSETEDLVTFTLRLAPLADHYTKKFVFDEGSIKTYQPMLGNGFSSGVYDGELLIGLAVAEVQTWNNTLWIHEFHIAERHRGQGIGKELMEHIAAAALTANIRILVCETQNKNVPAIRFYHKTGFSLEGLDLSHYRNTDHPDGEIAVFMKRRLI